MDIQKLCDPGIGCGSMCIVLLQCVRIYSLQHLFLWVTLFMEAKKKGKYTDFVKKGLLVCVIVLMLAAWWFIRNAILYDGDFIGMNASTICAEKYAEKELQAIPIDVHRRWLDILYWIC